MTAPRDVLAFVHAANAPLTDPSLHRRVGHEPPRFELYHFALSLCSQNVRLTLAEKNSSYVAHDLNVDFPLFGNYDPAYVRLRLLGAEGRRLVGGYTGRSSTTSEGLDPAVVPTLVDLDTGRVHLDSLQVCLQVCLHIDREGSGAELVPDRHREAVMRELAIVDGTPHVAHLYGAHPDGDFRPGRLKARMPGMHERKLGKLRQARALVADDAELRAAYDAKISKEEAAKSFVQTPEEMRRTTAETVQLVGDLEDRLSVGQAGLVDDAFTLADVMWSVSLFQDGYEAPGTGVPYLLRHRRKSVRTTRAGGTLSISSQRANLGARCHQVPLPSRPAYLARCYGDDREAPERLRLRGRLLGMPLASSVRGKGGSNAARRAHHEACRYALRQLGDPLLCPARQGALGWPRARVERQTFFEGPHPCFSSHSPELWFGRHHGYDFARALFQRCNGDCARGNQAVRYPMAHGGFRVNDRGKSDPGFAGTPGRRSRPSQHPPQPLDEERRTPNSCPDPDSRRTVRVTTTSSLSVAYFHGQRDAGDDITGDFFRLEMSTDGGSTFTTIASNADTTSNATWSKASASIPAGSDVVLRVQCSDGAGPGDLVECGIDDVSICATPGWNRDGGRRRYDSR